MNNDSSRVCSKCKKSLEKNEAYCTYCGTISGKPKKGTIIIQPDKIKIFILAFLVTGIILLLTSVILIIKYNNIVSILFGIAVSFITIGLALMKANNQIVNSLKEKNKLSPTDINHNHCKYCDTVYESGWSYCYFCGSKIK